MLLATVRFERGHHRSAALGLAAAVALKSFPILLLPVFLSRLPRWRERLGFSALVALPTGLLLAPFFVQDWRAVFAEVFGYAGVFSHGLAVIVRFAASTAIDTTALRLLIPAIFLVGYTVLAHRLVRIPGPLVCDIALVFTCFYALYAGISAQYLLWALPFLALLDKGALTASTAFGVVAVLSEYGPEHFAPLQAVPGVVVLVAWASTTLLWWYVNARWLITNARARAATSPTSRSSTHARRNAKRT
ncbi:MAG: hypothetical protein ACYC3S_17885 [Chloroflexota bacterium]